MKSKIKKILTSTLLSAVSITTIGCSSGNTKLAKNIDNGMAEFVSSINKLDYVDTSSPSQNDNENIGKIVETSTNNYDGNFKKYRADNSQIEFLNNEINELEIENTITRPDEHDDNFKLFVLSESPYIALSSNNNIEKINLSIKFSTDKIEEVSDDIKLKINTLILKRSILMIYVNELYNNNVNLSNDNKIAINAYVNVIKENASFLKGNRGMVKNQLNLANDLVTKESNENLINYYIIKSGEALETRASKIDSTISAIDSIIDIIENNLTSSSPYYDSDLSDKYDDIISNMQSNSSTNIESIDEDSTNAEIADSILNSLNFIDNKCENCETNESKNIDSKKHKTQNKVQNNNNKNNARTISNNNQSKINNTTRTMPSQNNNPNLQIISQNDDMNNQKINNNTTGNNKNINTINQNEVSNRQNLNNNKIQNNMSNKQTMTENNNNIISQNQNTSRQKQSTASNSTQNRKNYINSNNRNNLSQETNSNKDNYQNGTKSVNNMERIENEEKFLRADRTPNKSIESEEYEQSKQSNNMITNRATRVPYRTTNQRF